MLGLRTQETNKFISFFELVQKKAAGEKSVFFLDSGDGNELEGENLQGWLIPLSKVEEFEKIWKERKEDDKFIDFFCWVEWFDNRGNIDVRFTEN